MQELQRDNLMLRMSKEDWDTIIKVNLDSVFNLTKAVIKPMMKAKSGSIINMSSVVGVKEMQDKLTMQLLRQELLDSLNLLH